MARHLITGDKFIKAILPSDPGARVNDGDGLYLKLWVKGGKHGWRFDYSLDGRRNTLSLGTYPDTGLALARQKAEELRRLVAAGTDPSHARKAERTAVLADRHAQRLQAKGLPAHGTAELGKGLEAAIKRQLGLK